MNINDKIYTIGADPEVFLQLNGEFVSAHDVLPGTKQEPFLVNKGGVQVDGLAAEFNIDPAHSEEEFKNNLDGVTNILQGMIGDREFLEQVSVKFSEDFARELPTHSLVLGCEADYNGWSLSDNQPPQGSELMRTAGGHVHVGGFFSEGSPFKWKHFQKAARMSRIMDYTLGVYSILWDKDDERRGMYGQAGCFRPKKYGMEYRTLSNSWIFDPKLVSFVYRQTKLAAELFENTDFEPPEGIKDIINNSDRSNKFFDNNDTVGALLK